MMVTVRSLLLALAALAAHQAWGGEISVGAFPTWAEVEDFTVFRDSNPPDHGVPFKLKNLTFTDLSGDPDANRWIVFEQGTTIQFPVGEILGDNHTFSHLRIDFAAPVAMAGLDVGFFGFGTYEVAFFGVTGGKLGTVIGSNVPFNSFFAGWSESAGISRLEVLEVSPDNGFVTGIDNIRSVPMVASSVPEPSITIEALFGLLVLFSVRRRYLKARGRKEPCAAHQP